MSMPALITDAKLAMMRAHTAQHRPTPCQVLRNAPVPNGQGGWTDAWTTISDPSLTCRVSPWRPGRETEAMEAEQAQDFWEIALPWDTDVTAKDRIVATVPTSATASEQLTYEVQSIGPQTFLIERSLQCIRLVDLD
jgi:hypothetical protein